MQSIQAQKRSEIQGYCVGIIMILLVNSIMALWSSFWYAGFGVLLLGAIVDVSNKTHSLCWHVFMLIVTPLYAGIMAFFSYDVCYVYSSAPKWYEELLSECVLNSFMAFFSILIMAFEIKIVILGNAGGVPCCCCNKQPIHPEVVVPVQVAAQYPVTEAIETSNPYDIEKVPGDINV